MLKAVVFIGLLSVMTSAKSAPFCTWNISVLNSETREEKNYIPGNNIFDIPLQGLKGFKTCKALPEKVYEFYGSPTTRLEMYCFTTAGDAVMHQAVVSLKGSYDVTRFLLLARPVTIKTDADDVEIISSGYREFIMQCK